MDSGEVTILRRGVSPIASPSGVQVAVSPVSVFDVRSPQKLIPVVSRPLISPLTWTPDGKSIAYVEWARSFVDTTRVRLVNLTTGLDVPLITESGDVSFSPDGKRMVFARRVPETQKTVLFVADLDLSNCEQITSLDDYIP
jgi:Tol biopolymer transport system component